MTKEETKEMLYDIIVTKGCIIRASDGIANGQSVVESLRKNPIPFSVGENCFAIDYIGKYGEMPKIERGRIEKIFIYINSNDTVAYIMIKCGDRYKNIHYKNCTETYEDALALQELKKQLVLSIRLDS